MSLGPGARLGPYEIVAPLGAGGMGEVYKAKDTRFDRTVAIKVLPSHVSGDPALRERFEREARTIAALNHPHICTLYDVGREGGTDFLVLDYLEGQTLADRLIKGALPLEQALTCAIQIADALDKAHRGGIVHRDLKPGNIMLTKSGVKLLDFGLAKLQPTGPVGGLSVAATMTPPMTARGTILGTLHYMAPEQVEGKDADARTDIFAFGAVVYEMLTGKKAFEGKSPASVIAGILAHDPPPISDAQPLTPRVLDHVAKKCLAKDPEDRWQTAADVRSELKWVAEEIDGGTASAALSTRSLKRAMWAVGGVALLAIAALAVVATLYVRRAVPEPVVTRFDVVTPPTSDAFSFALSADGR
jgi:eukaryotic-like serine/threonine-protein kinase